MNPLIFLFFCVKFAVYGGRVLCALCEKGIHDKAAALLRKQKEISFEILCLIRYICCVVDV